MTDKQIIIDVCPYQGECSVSGCKRNDDGCFVRQLFEERYRAENQIVELNKKVEAKEQECENNKIAHQMELDIYNQECLNLQEELKAKEQEIKKLKSDNLQEIGQLKFAIGTLTAENLHLKELLDMRIEAICDSCMAGSMLPINCRIYKQRLLNIKEILTEGVCKNCSEDSANDCIPECDSHRILEIIKEVEDV